MDIKLLSEVAAWFKTTDLAELTYKKDGHSIEIKTKDALPEGANFDSVLSPVTSPAVGIYRAADKGKMLSLKEGQKVSEGEMLGVVAMPNTSHKVLANKTGTLRIISVTDGKPVEYGQPLFFIEP